MIALFGKTVHQRNVNHIVFLFETLRKNKLQFCIEEKYANILKETYKLQIEEPTFSNYQDIKSDTEMLISLGGDGTILEAITFIKEAETPILGINFGRLGFLANVSVEQIEQAIEIVAKGKYIIDKRTIIEINSNNKLFGNVPYALNEMTLQRKDQSSMITIKTFLNGELLNSYWADGLIISTPTGSTGYSLSCGGPILYPTSNNFVITPVAPHNLNVRPIVVSDDVILSFEVSGRENSFLCTLDSRFETIDSSFQIALKKAPFKANLVRLTDMNFIIALKTKLNWGSDQRN
jgi:NAD+ kinase